MSPRYSNVTTSIHELIIRYTSNNFRFIILDPTQRTSKSAPIFLPEKQGRKRASTPTHRLPRCHLGNPRVECQNIYQVNQYNTPLSPRVFICKAYIKCSQIHKNIQSHKTKSQRRSCHQEHEREIKHITTVTTPQPRGWTTPSSSWWPYGSWRWPPVMISPSGRVHNRV